MTKKYTHTHSPFILSLLPDKTELMLFREECPHVNKEKQIDEYPKYQDRGYLLWNMEEEAEIRKRHGRDFNHAVQCFYIAVVFLPHFLACCVTVHFVIIYLCVHFVWGTFQHVCYI